MIGGEKISKLQKYDWKQPVHAYCVYIAPTHGSRLLAVAWVALFPLLQQPRR